MKKNRKKIKKIIKKRIHKVYKRRGGSMENTQANWGDTPEEQEAFNRPAGEEIKRLKVLPGDYRLALIGNPYFYKRHWLDKQKRSVNCPGEGCPLCSSGSLPDGRYVVNVFNYKDNAVEIYEFGRGIKNELANIIRLWGNTVDSFDVVLTRTGTKKEDTKYTTVAVPRQDKLSKDLKPYDLTKIYKPTPIDVIIKILEGKVEEKKEEEAKPGETTGTGVAPAAAARPATATPPVEKKEGEVVIEDDTAEIDLDKLIESDN
jgi:hypothetical protein